MTKIAILQSNYIPWKGYFDLINDADYFVFYDEVQFTKNDWRNRNQINNKSGKHWLTVPVGQNISRIISDVIIPNPLWQKKHYKTLYHTYSKCPFFEYSHQLLDFIYQKNSWERLSCLNQESIKYISDFLGIKTEFHDYKGLKLPEQQDRSLKLVNIVKYFSGSTYISGPSAKSYIDVQLFSDNNINIAWKNYSDYPSYLQHQSNSFDHYVTVLDMIFNLGPQASQYIWGFKSKNLR